MQFFRESVVLENVSVSDQSLTVSNSISFIGDHTLGTGSEVYCIASLEIGSEYIPGGAPIIIHRFLGSDVIN